MNKDCPFVPRMLNDNVPLSPVLRKSKLLPGFLVNSVGFLPSPAGSFPSDSSGSSSSPSSVSGFFAVSSASSLPSRDALAAGFSPSLSSTSGWAPSSVAGCFFAIETIKKHPCHKI